MHQHLINAAIQILPIAQDRHPYLWVDEAIAIITKASIKYEIGPFTTVLEGTYDEVMQVVNSINNHLQEHNCSEWIMNVQIQIRANKDMTGDEKTAKYKVD